MSTPPGLATIARMEGEERNDQGAMRAETRDVTGRFAPSPSGPLHEGSVLAAIGSYLSAKGQGGRWLLRIDDIDAQRCHPIYAGQMQEQLTMLGLHWDGAIRYQSTCQTDYDAAFAKLRADDYVYPCGCSRQSLLQSPCRCRERPPAQPRAWRLDLRTARVDFWQDRYLGMQENRFSEQDPVLLRADGPYAYIFACVVDDQAQDVTEVIRGADLVSITPVQRFLQDCLGYPQPQYGHLPLVIGQDGKKLSKSAGAAAFDPRRAWEQSLRRLGFPTPEWLRGAPPDEWRAWALEVWATKKSNV
ncbi:MAG: tRNA glutamyl-Q(34) synthetase GluQRS [Candidatus Igneacidithiobacillus chanchocoensis]